MKKVYLSEKMNGMSSNVNMLRFLAAMLVIFCHAFYVSASAEDPLSLFSKGQTNFGGFAVAIFFFLSGFYVTKSLYKTSTIKEFMWKRCVRIFPQLWTVVFVTVFVLGPLVTQSSLFEYFSNKSTYAYLLNGIFLPIHNLPGVFQANVYDTTVNGPLWTMPVEFVAYCAVAIVMFLCKYVFKKEKMQKLFHGICLVCLLAMFVGVSVVIKNDFLITVIRPLVIFFVGVIYCDYAEKIILNQWLAVISLFVLILGCRFDFLNYAMMVCLPYVIVTFMLGWKQTKWKFGIFMISYEMYLFGWPIQQYFVHLFGGQMNPYLNFALTLPIDIILAYLLYKGIEVVTRKVEKKR